MKRYLTFYGTYYYPGGGMSDFIGDFDTVKEAKRAIEEKHKDHYDYPDWDTMWANVYDTETRQIIFKID